MRISKRVGISATAVAFAVGLGTAGLASAEAQTWAGEPACLQGKHGGTGILVNNACKGGETPPQTPRGVRVSIAVPKSFDPACKWTGDFKAGQPFFDNMEPSTQWKPYFCDA